MKIKFVFKDWEKDGKSIYSTEEGIQLSLGPFHSGTTFDGDIIFDEDEAVELFEAIKDGYTPVFYLIDSK